MCSDHVWMLFVTLGLGILLGLLFGVCILFNRITSEEENSIKLTVMKNLKRNEQTETLQPL